MLRKPDVKIQRFEQLDPGDIFVHVDLNQSYIGIKVIDDQADGDTLLLPLGRTASHSDAVPRLKVASSFTAVSYGKDYVLRLPSAMNAWGADIPTDFFCLAITTEDTFFLANFGTPGEFRPCFVNASNGRLRYLPKMPRILAYALQWELAVRFGDNEEQLLVRHPAMPLPSSTVTKP